MLYDTRVANTRFAALLMWHAPSARDSVAPIMYPVALPCKDDTFFVSKCSYVTPKVDLTETFVTLCLENDLLPVDLTEDLRGCDKQSQVMNLHRYTVMRALQNPREVYFFANDTDKRLVSRLQAYAQLKDLLHPPGRLLSPHVGTPALFVLRNDNFAIVQSADNVAQIKRAVLEILTDVSSVDDECPLCLTPYTEVARDVQLFTTCLSDKHTLEWFLEGEDTDGPTAPYKGDENLLRLQRKYTSLGEDASDFEVKHAFALRVSNLGYVRRGKFACGHSVCGRCFGGAVYSVLEACCVCRCEKMC